MKAKDIFLVAVQLIGMAGGTFFPQFTQSLGPWVVYMMMTFLFLSFTKIELRAVVRARLRELVEVILWTTVKLAVMPPVVWVLFGAVVPRYELPAMLLAGVSTGVVAPFLAGILDANVPRVLQVVVITSVLVPISLPAWVKLLTGEEFELPFLHMAKTLGMVIFIPLGASALLRAMWPGLVKRLNAVQYPLSLCLFLAINLGIFASYSELLKSDPWEVVRSLAVAGVLACISPCAALLTSRAAPRVLDPLTGAICLTFINNVLIVVFSSRYFEARAPLVAAMYMIPFFLMVIPIRRLKGKGGAN